MQTSTRRKSIAVFVTLGVFLIAAAVALNVTWIVFHWRQWALLIVGLVFFLAIIAGMVLNTIFLVREIRRNEQHDSFINAVTHELKTPIAALRLYLETLKRRPLSDQQRQEFYDIMMAENTRLLHTVEQVLRAGRTGQKGRSLAWIELDLADLASEAVELARTQYHLDAVHLSLAIERNRTDGATKVMGDPEELRAAISNLLDNAIKYSGPDPKVAVEVVPGEKQQVIVRVRDNGIGIPAHETKQIFKRFYRVPGDFMARVKGTGLGLFIVQSVIARHGGRVRAESQGSDRGSTFIIELPRAYE